MRTPTMRTPMRGSRGRNPTPLPSRPVRGGPKITEQPRIQKTPPKTPPSPRTTGRGLGGSTKGGPGPMTIARGGKSDIRTPRGQRPTKTAPYGGRVPKRVKETLSPIKKTPEQHNQMVAALRAAEQAKLDNKAPNQKQPTGSRAAAMRRRKISGGLKGALRRGAAAKASKPPAPTGSRAAAMRRRQRSGGLAGALRRARSR